MPRQRYPYSNSVLHAMRINSISTLLYDQILPNLAPAQILRNKSAVPKHFPKLSFTVWIGTILDFFEQCLVKMCSSIIQSYIGNRRTRTCIDEHHR